jgi:hypothetical protein
MLALSIAAGLSFVLPAAAQTPTRANVLLQATCDPPSVPPNRDTVLTCSFRVENEGTESLSQAQLQFLPGSAVGPPDRYYFFSETIDGLARETSGDDTSYDLGNVGSHEVRSVAFRIIVRSSHHFGADVAVVAQPDQYEYARRSLTIGATAEPPSVDFSLIYEGQVSSSQTVSLGLRIENHAQDAVDAADLELEPGYKYSVEDPGFELVPLAGGDGFFARYTASLGFFAPGYVSEEPISLQTAAGVCLTPNPAAVATVHIGGRSEVLAALADLPDLPCGGAHQSTANFPATGVRDPGDTRPELPALLLAVVGALCGAMGVTLRYRQRRH